ncbi:MAG: phosphomannomutase/phosphoglucomutase, partial [Pseudomonadota bacterium]
GLVTAMAVCDMIDRNPDRSMADLRRALPLTYGSPTMSPHCPDEEKYDVAERIKSIFEKMKADGETIGSHAIVDLITVNGVRVVTADGTWGLLRPSSNAPELVVVVESPVSEARKHEMFEAMDAIISGQPEVGEYNQKL